LFDLHGKEDVPEGSASIVNRAEAEFVLCLYKHMLSNVGELREGAASLAVISPYKAQVSHRWPMPDRTTPRTRGVDQGQGRASQTFQEHGISNQLGNCWDL